MWVNDRVCLALPCNFAVTSASHPCAAAVCRRNSRKIRRIHEEDDWQVDGDVSGGSLACSVCAVRRQHEAGQHEARRHEARPDEQRSDEERRNEEGQEVQENQEGQDEERRQHEARRRHEALVRTAFLKLAFRVAGATEWCTGYPKTLSSRVT